MAQNSKIEWTDSTWNPIRGCSMAKGSELGGCLNCYAARLNARNLPNLKSPTTGEPFARILDSGPRWTGKIEVIPSVLNLPLILKQPQRIFVYSQSDLFHEDLAFEDIDRVIAVMASACHHTYQVLTKRPEIARAYFVSRSAKWAPGHRLLRSMERLWLGVSTENQRTAELRIPILLTLPVRIHFLSYEPALGPLVLDGRKNPALNFLATSATQPFRVDWIIAGGESGPEARPAHPDWFRSIRDQCAAAGIPFFFKQHGNWISAGDSASRGRQSYVDREGGNQGGAEGSVLMRNVGKSAAGALLDDRSHTDLPSSG